MTQTIAWTLEQWGTANAGVWTDLIQMGLEPTGLVIVGGMVFSTTNLRLAPDGRVVEAPFLTAFALACDANHGGADPTPQTHTLEFGVVPDPVPAVYSDQALPWARGEVSLGTLTATTQLTPAQATVTFTFGEAALTALRTFVTCRGYWNGRLALSVRNITGGATAIRLFSVGTNITATLTASGESPWRGLVGGPLAPRTRWVRDYRYGMPALNGELVRDGDNPGLWVRAWDADPEDPPATYRPRPGEGTVDDDIGSL